MQSHGIQSPHHSSSAEARDEAEGGQVTLQGSPKFWVCQASGQGWGLVRKGEPPCPPPQRPGRPRPLRGSQVRLPPAAWSVCTPSSARQSGAPTEVRQRGPFAHGPAPVSLAWPGPLLSAGRIPSLLLDSPAWGPSNPRPLRRAAPSPPARAPADSSCTLGLNSPHSPQCCPRSLRPTLTLPPPPSSRSATFMVE